MYFLWYPFQLQRGSSHCRPGSHHCSMNPWFQTPSIVHKRGILLYSWINIITRKRIISRVGHHLTSRLCWQFRNTSTKHLHISGFTVSLRSAMMLFISFLLSSTFFINSLQFFNQGPSQGNTLYIYNETIHFHTLRIISFVLCFYLVSFLTQRIRNMFNGTCTSFRQYPRHFPCRSV